MGRVQPGWPLSAVVALSCLFPLSATGADIQATLQKANAYIETSKMTERAVESWERYQSWVNMKTGPTGKERYISYGMYELYDIGGLLQEARGVASAEPKIADLDEAMTRYISAYEALAPVINQASAYYERQGYTTDNAAEGKALHLKMLPLAKTFIAEREGIMPRLRAFARDVEQQELVAMEARGGRTAAWQVGNVLHSANRVIDVFPRNQPAPMDSETLDAKIDALGPQSSGAQFDEIIMGSTPPQNVVIDAKRFSEAVKSYADAVAGMDKVTGEKPDDFDEFKTHAQQMLDALRKFEGPLTKSQGKEFDGGAMLAGQIMNGHNEMFNTGNGMVGSQLRYLP